MTDWPKAYRRGSTIFKEILKKGKVDHYRCVICGDDSYTPILLDTIFESHEIMHLLQQLLANHTIQEPIMQEEQESE